MKLIETFYTVCILQLTICILVSIFLTYLPTVKAEPSLIRSDDITKEGSLGVIVTPSYHSIYLSSNGKDTIFVIDNKTGKVIDSLLMGVKPFDIYQNNSANHKLYIINSFDVLSIVDSETNYVMNIIPSGIRSIGTDSNSVHENSFDSACLIYN